MGVGLGLRLGVSLRAHLGFRAIQKTATIHFVRDLSEDSSNNNRQQRTSWLGRPKSIQSAPTSVSISTSTECSLASRGMQPRFSSLLGAQALSIKSQQLPTVFQITCSTMEAITAMSLAPILRP